MSTQQTHPDHPTPDLLLRDFLLSPYDLFALADTHNLSLDALIAWWSDPATKARLRALEEIAEARRDIRAKLHAAKAIDRLSALAESTGNQPSERRHCANSILKHSPATRTPKKLAAKSPSEAAHPHRASNSSAASDRATGFGVSPTPVEEPPTITDVSCNPNAPARPSARGESPCHESPAPDSTHETPSVHPTHRSHDSHWSHQPHPLSLHSPLTHDAPTTAQGRPESEAGEIASIAGQLA